ncbi:MAG: hypothetical protein ABH879_09425 [archaeon]
MSFKPCTEYGGGIDQVYLWRQKTFTDTLADRWSFLRALAGGMNPEFDAMAGQFPDSEVHRFNIGYSDPFICDAGIFAGHVNGQPLVLMTQTELITDPYVMLGYSIAFEQFLITKGVRVERVPFVTIGGDTLIAGGYGFVGNHVMQATAEAYRDYAKAAFAVDSTFDRLNLDAAILDPPAGCFGVPHKNRNGFYHLDTLVAFGESPDGSPIAALAELQDDPDSHSIYADYVGEELDRRGFGLASVPAYIVDGCMWSAANVRIDGEKRKAYMFTSHFPDLDQAAVDSYKEMGYDVIIYNANHTFLVKRAGYRCCTFVIRS